MAQGLFAVANQPVTRFATPAGRVACASTSMNKRDILRLARRHRVALLPVVDPTGARTCRVALTYAVMLLPAGLVFTITGIATKP